jgi:hypothetical protein
MKSIQLVCMTVAVAVAAIAASQRSPDAVRLGPPASIDVGGRSGDIALADLNRDGNLDLLVARGQQAVAAISFGNGRGQFTAGEAVTLPAGAGGVALGDVSGDGVPDLIVAYRSDGREYVGVMPGDGRGRFRTAASSYVTGSAFAFYKPVLRIIDINEDGRPDIVSANGRRNSLEILFGDGLGAFTAGPQVMLDDGDFRTFAMADVDQDRHVDIVSSSYGAGSDRVNLRRGDGTGRFGARIALPDTAPNARVIALAEVTGDGRADIVLAHGEAALLTVFANAGGGRFTPAAGSPYAIPAEAFEAAVADVTGDRQLDLILTAVESTSRPYQASLVVLQGDGRGFTPAAGSPVAVGRGAYNLAFGDVNRDGKPDVATSSFEGDPVMLLLGQ